jgi:ParB-like chromosome segregation protein Spo0J
LKIEMVDIETVIPYPNNPRNNSRSIAKVAASLKEFGWQQPIVVDKDTVIIVGHTRLEGAKQLGLKKVPIHRALDLSEAQVKAYRIADNVSGAIATFDAPMLALEMADLRNADYPLANTGFELAEIDIMLAPPELMDEPDAAVPVAVAHRASDLVITIGKNRVPVTPAELERGLARVAAYLDSHGTLYGFAASLLGLVVLPQKELL